MSRICEVAEDSAQVTLDRDFLDRVFTAWTSRSPWRPLFTAYHLKVKAIAALTESVDGAVDVAHQLRRAESTPSLRRPRPATGARCFATPTP